MNTIERLLKIMTGFSTHEEVKANEEAAKLEAKNRMQKVAEELKKILVKGNTGQ